MSTTQTGKPLELDPRVILANPAKNGRFNLKPARIKALAANIMEMGGIMTPIEVSPLSPPQGKFTHEATMGFYRIAAALTPELIAAGVKVPVVVRETTDPLEALRRNLAENMERENQSPMDIAVAIKKLMDGGMSKIEVRKLYKRPGRKEPASNSWVNIVLSFLDLPKAIQNKIHDGLIGFDAAAVIAKAAPEKRQAIMDKIDQDREAAIARELKEDERLNKEEAKLQAAKEAAETAEKEAKELAATKEKELKEATEAVEAAQLALKATTDAVATDSKAAKDVPVKAKELEKARGVLEKVAKKYAPKEAAATEKVQSATGHANERAAKLKEAREAEEKKKGATAKPVSKGEAQKAAASTGASTNYVALKAAEQRELIHGLTLAGNPEKVQEVFKQVERAFTGEITPKQLDKELAALKFLK